MSSLASLPPEMLDEIVARLDDLSATLLALSAKYFLQFDFFQKKRVRTEKVLKLAVQSAYWGIVRDALTWHYFDSNSLDVLPTRVTKNFTDPFFVELFNEYIDPKRELSAYYNDIDKWETLGEKKGGSLIRLLNARQNGPKLPPFCDLILSAHDLDFSYLEDNLEVIIDRDSMQIGFAFMAKAWMCNAAVAKGSKEMVELLRKHDCGAPFVSSRRLFLPLAIHSGKKHMVEFALDVPRHGVSPLSLEAFISCYKKNRIEFFRLLCETVTAARTFLSTICGYVANNMEYYDIARREMEKKGVPISSRDFLEGAMMAGNVKEIRALLSGSISDSHKGTFKADLPNILELNNGHPEITKIILERNGESPNLSFMILQELKKSLRRFKTKYLCETVGILKPYIMKEIEVSSMIENEIIELFLLALQLNMYYFCRVLTEELPICFPNVDRTLRLVMSDYEDYSVTQIRFLLHLFSHLALSFDAKFFLKTIANLSLKIDDPTEIAYYFPGSN